MNTEKVYSEITEKLFKKVKEHYGENLVSFVIFGSVARGTQTPVSDIDILIIAENLPRGRTSRIMDFIENVENPLEREIKKYWKAGYHIEISPLIKTPEEVRYGGFIYLDMIEDCVILFDKNRFFKNYLEELSEKLKKWGAKKVYKKGGYYWVLKKDVDVKKGIEI